MSLALPPVGTHSTALQLGHTTTVWEWENTVVLREGKRGSGRVSGGVQTKISREFKLRAMMSDPGRGGPFGARLTW